MEQLIIETAFASTSAAIKEFAGRFNDASVSVQQIQDDSFYEDLYGIKKKDFESRLNIGIAESVLGMTKPWDEVRAELQARISGR